MQNSRLVPEFDYLKISALFLLIFVHSDLIIAFPEVIYPLEWFLLSAFFFVSGFLAYNSFHRREDGIRRFLKPKALSLYIPFMVASVFYFVLQISMGAKADAIKLISQVSMLNIFDGLNTIYNWSFLWFIPYLLAFMLIVCLLEKYVKSTRIQLLIVSFLWLSSILLWVYDSPMRLGQLFSQYLLVFIVGFWISKLKIYEKIMSFKMAFFAVPLVAFFSVNFSGLFTYNTQVEALKNLLYSNGRGIIFSLTLVLLFLLFLRKTKIPQNRYIKLIASMSVIIYLVEPFISFALLNYVFGQSAIFLADGTLFYLFQVTRVFVLLVLLPLGFMGARGLYYNRGSTKFAALRRLSHFG